MDYILIIILELIGIGLHVMQKVLALDAKFPDDSLKDVFALFWKSDRITLIMSGLVLALNVVGHYIVEGYAVELTKIEYYNLYSFGLALVLGYAGQRLIYKYLGQAEALLDKKVSEKILQ